MVENPVKPCITKFRKNLEKTILIQKKNIEKQAKAITISSTLCYGKDLNELNKEQTLIKWRKGFYEWEDNL